MFAHRAGKRNIVSSPINIGVITLLFILGSNIGQFANDSVGSKCVTIFLLTAKCAQCSKADAWLNVP